MMKIKTVLVVGSGAMGAGIGQLCAQQGFNVVITDINQELSDKAKSNIEKGLSRRVTRGKITEEDKAAILTRISTAGDLSPANNADFVIESVSENLE
ncbi:MAG: 3-hydroxyacyl-CoA dehydrogenase family protein, partial [Desulfobacterales bacterium]